MSAPLCLDCGACEALTMCQDTFDRCIMCAMGQWCLECGTKLANANLITCYACIAQSRLCQPKQTATQALMELLEIPL